MIIEETELKELLKKQSESVEKKRFPIEAIISLVAFILSAVMAQIYSQKLFVKILFLCFVALNLVYVLYLIVQYRKSVYSNVDLINDLKKSSTVRNFSLVVIKDKSGKFIDKYLLRYDLRWKCWLLPYRETHVENDALFILDYVGNILGLKDVELGNVKTDDIEKFSVSDKMTKKYHHIFYEIKIDAEKSGLKNRTVKINGEKFKWFSIDQMKRNKSIERKNSETVKFVGVNF